MIKKYSIIFKICKQAPTSNLFKALYKYDLVVYGPINSVA